jgi:ribosomal protein L11 methyltransferase
VVLAGLLDTQADAVAATYDNRGCRLVDGGSGEWRILVLERLA